MIPKAVFIGKIVMSQLNTYTDVKAGADITLGQLLWRMKCAEEFNQWR